MSVQSIPLPAGTQAVLINSPGNLLSAFSAEPPSILSYDDSVYPSMVVQTYPSLDDAVDAALAIDPSYDVNLSYPFLRLEFTGSGDPVTAVIGSSVTLDAECVCVDDPTATITYQWKLPSGEEITGATYSTLLLDNVTEKYDGTYVCSVLAENTRGRTGSFTVEAQLSVVPAPEPSGVLNAGRSGAGPQDLAPSYFPSLSNMPAGVTEADLELYIPGTNTVIPYNNSLPAPFKFDSMGNCYNPGDYRTVIRVAETGAVLATVTPVEGPNKDIFWLYNPVVPAAPAGISVAIEE